MSEDYIEMDKLPGEIRKKKRHEFYSSVGDGAKKVSGGVHNASLFVSRQWKATQPVRQKISKGAHNLETAYKNKPSTFRGGTGEEHSAFNMGFGTTLFPSNNVVRSESHTTQRSRVKSRYAPRPSTRYVLVETPRYAKRKNTVHRRKRSVKRSNSSMFNLNPPRGMF